MVPDVIGTPFLCGLRICPVPQLIQREEDAYSFSSIKYGTPYISPEHKGPVQASMPPPPVAMAASKLRIQTLQEELKRKDRIIHALEDQNRSHLACEAEKAKFKELAKMNKGWRKHNAIPYTSRLTCIDGVTQDQRGAIKNEKVMFVTEYRFAMERVKKLDAEARELEARVQTSRAEQRDAYRKTQELIKVAEELDVRVAEETRMRIARSSPKETQGTTTTHGNTTDSGGDANMENLSAAATSKNTRLVLNPPKRDRSLSMENSRSARLIPGQPTRERSVTVEEGQPRRLILSQPKRKDITGSPASAKETQPIGLRLGPPRAEKVGADLRRVRSGRVLRPRRR